MSALTKEQFGEFVTRYERLVYTICWQLTRDAAAAEDLTQETFLSAYLHRESCAEGYEKPWLARIAANKARDYLQSAYQRHTLLTGDEGMPPARAGPSSEELALSRSGAEKIRGLIGQLREPYRSVCGLSLLEERSPEEIALALGRPVKTVHTQLARGKKILQAQLKRREEP